MAEANQSDVNILRLTPSSGADDVNILRLTPFSSSSIARDDFDVDAGQSLLVESQSFGSPIGQVNYAFP